MALCAKRPEFASGVVITAKLPDAELPDMKKAAAGLGNGKIILNVI